MEQGYTTLHAFRCSISASWDLIKITVSKIPVRWKFREDNTLYILTWDVSIPSLEKYELIHISMAASKVH